MSSDLLGRVALVTGAARAQGRSHAIALARAGADVIALDICHDLPTITYSLSSRLELEHTCKEIEALGRRAVAVQTDVRDTAALVLLVDDAVRQLGRLDIVVANAGVVRFGTIEEHSDEIWDEVIGVNLTGVMRTIRAAVPHLKAAGRGSVVVTSSAMGLKGGANMVAYTASKHGVVGLVRGLAIDLGKFGIRVNSVHPTGVDTPMVHNQETYELCVPDKEEPTAEDLAPVYEAMNLLDIPWVQPEDISAAVLFLASDAARYITGIQLPVDAGLTTK